MKSIPIVLMLLALWPATEKNVIQNTDVGDMASGFNLKNVDGNRVSLMDYNDQKGVIVVFTCNTCPYSRMYEQRILELDKKFKSKGFPVVAIQPNDPGKSPGDSFSAMKDRAEEKGYTFPYLMDETQQITKAYGATNTPHVYVLEREEKDEFIVRYIGAIDNNSRDASKADKHYVEAAVNSILDGKEVDQTKTKAIGCTIKWR